MPKKCLNTAGKLPGNCLISASLLPLNCMNIGLKVAFFDRRNLKRKLKKDYIF